MPVPNFTKKAIKESFMELLNERPLNKISVRDIVERCGINRNSFYYHFQDIPALLEELITEVFDNLLDEYPDLTDIDECFSAGFNYILKNKKAMLHIYTSLNRDMFEKSLMQFCGYVVDTYIDSALKDKNVAETEKIIIKKFFKCTLFGAYIDWLASGMPENAINEVKTMFSVCKGMSDEIIRRCKEAENN